MSRVLFVIHRENAQKTFFCLRFICGGLILWRRKRDSNPADSQFASGTWKIATFSRCSKASGSAANTNKRQRATALESQTIA